MALDANRLGDAIRQAIDALDDEDKSNRVTVFRAMGAAIVAEIQEHATVTVTSVTGVTTGGGTSGPGTGTVS